MSTRMAIGCNVTAREPRKITSSVSTSVSRKVPCSYALYENLHSAQNFAVFPPKNLVIFRRSGDLELGFDLVLPGREVSMGDPEWDVAQHKFICGENGEML